MEKINQKKEIYGVLCLAFALLLGFMFYAPEKYTGFFGVWFKALGFGLFGTIAYILPLFFIYVTFEYILEKQKDIAIKRYVCVLISILILATLISAFTVRLEKLELLFGGAASQKATDAIAQLWKFGNDPSLIGAGSKISGGLLGGLFALGLERLFGFIGTIIIYVTLLIVMCVFIFNFSYTGMIKKTAAILSEQKEKLNDAWHEQKEKQQHKDNNVRDKQKYDIKLEHLKPEEEVPDSIKKAEAAEALGTSILEQQVIDQGQFDENDPLDSIFDDLKMHQEIGQVEYELPQGNWVYDPENGVSNYVVDIPMLRSNGGLVSKANIKRVPNKLDIEVEMDLEKTSGKPVFSDILEDIRRVNIDLKKSKKTGLESKDFEGQEAEDGDNEILDNGRANWEDRSETLAGAVPLQKIKRKAKQTSLGYVPPPLELLREDKAYKQQQKDQAPYKALGLKLEETLKSFGVEAKLINYTSGPTITRFELQPGPGVKVSKIVGLSDDIALSLAALSIRIEAPIPGKSAVGIEIPNAKTSPVLLRGLLESSEFKTAVNPLTTALGRDIQGKPILCDLARMPHLLIAGATGSGKSVCINSILMSLIYKTSPEKLKLLMIDPKVVELSVYNGIPHLLQPVVTDPKKAYGVLNWAVIEMERRYRLFAEIGVRDVNSYNDEIKNQDQEQYEYLPLILLIIDELADLMATTPKEVEAAIARLSAMARAAGIHLIIATQRPSVDVLTGVIKANIPSRIAFAVASQVDSRTILDSSGAEKLLGKGDMLYAPQSASKPQRGQGAFINDSEVERVLSYVKSNYAAAYDDEIEQAIERNAKIGQLGSSKDDKSSGQENKEDELVKEALRLVIETGYASTSLLQRRLSIGYPRASRMIEHMHDMGYIGPFEGSKPRKILISMNEFIEKFSQEDEE